MGLRFRNCHEPRLGRDMSVLAIRIKGEGLSCVGLEFWYGHWAGCGTSACSFARISTFFARTHLLCVVNWLPFRTIHISNSARQSGSGHIHWSTNKLLYMYIRKLLCCYIHMYVFANWYGSKLFLACMHPHTTVEVISWKIFCFSGQSWKYFNFDNFPICSMCVKKYTWL